MFDVLVYVYENYWRPDACPDAALLSRKLSAVGFESEEIRDALHWLDGLTLPESAPLTEPGRLTHRVYAAQEIEQLGDEGLAFIRFLESAGVLDAAMREQLIDRALAASDDPLPLDELKIIVLMMYWSRGEEPDALIFDELFVVPEDRVIH